MAAVLGILVLWQLLHAFLGGPEESNEDRRVPTLGATGSSGSFGTGDAPPAPEGSARSTFPGAVDGTRLELKVIALGTHPPDCEPESLRTQVGSRVVYHHQCLREPGLDRYFFLVRLTNHSKGRVYVDLDGFAVSGDQGKPRTAFATPPIGSPSTRFIAASRAIADGESIKGWITIDGTDGFAPTELVYADGAESLVVRLAGDWIG